MTEPAANPPPADAAEALATLRQQGADRIDPVRFHYLQALAQRAQAQPAPVRRMLDGKLAAALADYRQRSARAPQASNATPEPTHPATPLAALLDHIARQNLPALQEGSSDAASNSASDSANFVDRQPDLKSLRQFGDSWSKLGASQAVNQALAAAPPNAGPLNSHALMLQALKLMRDTAPDYLVRFLAHADTLLWLEQANSSPHSKKTAARSKAAPRRSPAPTRR